MPTFHSACWRPAGLVLLPLTLAACSTLPASGPTAAQINRGARAPENTIGFRILDIDSDVLQKIASTDDMVNAQAPTLASLAAEGRNDTVGPGDVLAISIYEVGVVLFGTGRSVGELFDPAARGENFPMVVVDTDGTITLPYVGRLVVAGHTPTEIQAMINDGLRGKSQNPQTIVAVKLNLNNTVFVNGDVRRPGRFELSLQRERLLDAIAASGGAAYSSEDTLVRFNRGTRTMEERLGRIRPGAPDDLVLLPGDRIELIKRPRSFIVLGATTRPSQISFETGELSLAEAVARAGGPSDAVADPSAVFLFRYDPAIAGTATQPTVYRLNMMKPSSYFLSQRIAIHDKDVIYIGNAAANQPAKLVGIINQLFSPFITARAIAR